MFVLQILLSMLAYIVFTVYLLVCLIHRLKIEAVFQAEKWGYHLDPLGTELGIEELLRGLICQEVFIKCLPYILGDILYWAVGRVHHFTSNIYHQPSPLKKITWFFHVWSLPLIVLKSILKNY